MTYGAFRMALAKQMVMKNHKNENYSESKRRRRRRRHRWCSV